MLFCSFVFYLFIYLFKAHESGVRECECPSQSTAVRANAIHFAGTVISSIRLPGRCSRQSAGSGTAGKTLSTLFYSPLRKLILLIDCCPWLPTLSPSSGGGRGSRKHRWTPGVEKHTRGCSQSGRKSIGVQWTFLLNFPSTRWHELRWSHVVSRWSEISEWAIR